MAQRKLENIDEVIRELDAWMQHYAEWLAKEPDSAHCKQMMLACERARNLLADTLYPAETHKGIRA